MTWIVLCFYFDILSIYKDGKTSYKNKSIEREKLLKNAK